jgi:hypothetical protein
MDIFSSDELYSIKNLFWQGNYAKLLAEDTNLLSPEGQEHAALFCYRARIALGESSAVAKELANVTPTKSPELVAVCGLAEVVLGRRDRAMRQAQPLLKLVPSSQESVPGQNVILASVLYLCGDEEEALRVLEASKEDPEAYVGLIYRR